MSAYEFVTELKGELYMGTRGALAIYRQRVQPFEILACEGLSAGEIHEAELAARELKESLYTGLSVFMTNELGERGMDIATKAFAHEMLQKEPVGPVFSQAFQETKSKLAAIQVAFYSIAVRVDGDVSRVVAEHVKDEHALEEASESSKKTIDRVVDQYVKGGFRADRFLEYLQQGRRVDPLFTRLVREGLDGHAGWQRFYLARWMSENDIASIAHLDVDLEAYSGPEADLRKEWARVHRGWIKKYLER